MHGIGQNTGPGKNMEALERRLIALENGARFDATKEAVQQVEHEFLIKLRDIRATIPDAGSDSESKSSTEYARLRVENEELKQINKMLQRQVKDLDENVTSLEEDLNKSWLHHLFRSCGGTSTKSKKGALEWSEG